ncbi:MAG: prolyl oligopeptidase family serine peptidase [Candidatus Aminicenantes bacterium]|nr:prolyl oligopeptidase family serine peptidase [Candidatus Aminicenantes bacterium]
MPPLKIKHLIPFMLLTVFLGSLRVSSLEQPHEEPGFKLTIDQIMKGPELVGTSPSRIMWSYDSQKLYFRWKRPDEKQTEFYFLSVNDFTPQKITLEEILKNPPIIQSASSFYGYRSGFLGIDLDFDQKKNRAVLVRNGDIFLMDLQKGELTQITETNARESHARFTPSENEISFISDDNLFVLSLKDSSIKQMTSFTHDSPPQKKEPDEIQTWYRQQQKQLFKEFSQTRAGSRPYLSFSSPKKIKPFYLKEHQNIYLLSLSPDLKYVFFMMGETNPDAKNTLVPEYVTRNGYTGTIPAHAKAAHLTRNIKAGILECRTGKVKWIDYDGEGKIINPSMIEWSPDGTKCLLTARSEDRKDIWLFRLDVTTGKTSVIEHVHDEAWIGYLGLTNILWWPDSEHISYISEKSGFAHLYKASWSSGKTEQLTSGNFELYSAEFNKDHTAWHITSNEKHPGERHLYHCSLNGTKRTRITSLTGHNQALVSPDEKYLAVLHSSSTHPEELYIKEYGSQKTAQRITVSSSQAFRSFDWYKPQVLTFRARDGKDVYARVYKPEKWHLQKPSVIFIHGAGYLQNAHKGWSHYYREYMFHNFLIHKGYLVLDIDYRGSAGYGRDCRTAIYRHMGGKDLDDIVDGARFLQEHYGANPEKMGVYGGSYGGFLTFMALFTEPDVFQAGAALRPVTDWAHYHNSYTQDILNLPQNDEQAYKQSSPIYFAEGLKSALLICHGMVDTNVHFQDTVRLVQRLIELGKQNWEVAIYPVEGHSFHNASSWADEYKRIFKLFEENLK